MKTIVLDVNTSIPVEVAQEALASRALTILEREVSRAAKKAIEDFIAHGITAELGKLAVISTKSTVR